MFKKWWVWLIAVMLFVVIIGAFAEEEEEPQEIAANETEEVEKEEEEVEKEEEVESEPLTREEEIEALVQKIIDEDLNGTEAKEIKVNENAGLGDGSYIVLPHLVWDVKNGADTTKEMLERYSDHIAAELASESDISEITVFWEVPYHLEGENTAKFNYAPQDGGMAKGDIWHDPILQ